MPAIHTNLKTIGLFLLSALLYTQSGAQFTKHTLTNDFISEGSATADINRDGKPDIIAGAFWFEAPAWTKHALAKADTFNPATGYSNSFLNFAMDVNQDGWVDIIRIGLPGEEAVWYENNQNKPGLWKMRLIQPNLGNESPAMVDVDGDGRPDLLGNDPENKAVIWLKAPSKKGDTAWVKYIIAQGEDVPGTHKYTHGLGFGDMNGDGRPDVVITKGWWEAPADRTQTGWTFHPADLGEECSQMFITDVDGDGDVDIISASAHNYGIWWHEQVKAADGSSKWVHHEICKDFSETHALAIADINGDGLPDLVTGKRYFAHNGGDPGGRDAAVLYWFERKPGNTPEWVAHKIDDNSGVGLQVWVQDMNKDGLPDIIVGNKKGVFWFEQHK
jgi:hypothetical protein